MSWMKVSIAHQDATAVKEEAKALMNKFSASYLAAGAPEEARVYRARLPAVGDVYYFSPTSSAVAMSLLAECGAVACAEPPDVKNLTEIKL